MSALNTLVTGGAGFLGSHFCDRLIAEGHSVIVVDDLCTGDLRNLEQHRNEARLRFEEHDICEPFDFGAVDLIFNFASPASPADYINLGIETLKVGAYGTLNGLELAKKYGARFLTASTSECYGDPLKHPQPESYWGNVNPIGPRSVYDESKRFAEAATAAYRKYHKLETQIVRIFNTYGPRLQMNDGRVISNFMKRALQGEPLTVNGDGSQTRSFCYVSDEVEGIYRLAMSGHPGPMNIGNPDEFTILQCAKEVLAVTDSKSGIEFAPLPQDDPKQRCPDITLAREILLWEPKVKLRDGLKQSLEYFRAATAARV